MKDSFQEMNQRLQERGEYKRRADKAKIAGFVFLVTTPIAVYWLIYVVLASVLEWMNLIHRG